MCRYLVSAKDLDMSARSDLLSYPIGSLKSRLCIRGRDLLYDRCAALDIGHRKTEKVRPSTVVH